jgi:hypothetical protein
VPHGGGAGNGIASGQTRDSTPDVPLGVNGPFHGCEPAFS